MNLQDLVVDPKIHALLLGDFHGNYTLGIAGDKLLLRVATADVAEFPTQIKHEGLEVEVIVEGGLLRPTNLQDLRTKWKRLDAERTPRPWYSFTHWIESHDRRRLADQITAEDAAAIVEAMNNYGEVLAELVRVQEQARCLTQIYQTVEKENDELKAEVERLRRLVGDKLTEETERMGLYDDEL